MHISELNTFHYVLLISSFHSLRRSIASFILFSMHFADFVELVTRTFHIAINKTLVLSHHRNIDFIKLFTGDMKVTHAHIH